MSVRVRRSKPYVCVDCDFADHFRFQGTKDLDAAAGAWLRCLAHSRAQEQDGRVALAWLRRNFATSFDRIEELVAVGLLRMRADGDYEIHAYAPRNQTRAMMDDDRREARKRMRASRKRGASRPTGGGAPTASESAAAGQVAPLIPIVPKGTDVSVTTNVAPNACENGAIRNRLRVDDFQKRSPGEPCNAHVATPPPGSPAPIPSSPSVSSDAERATGNANGVEEMANGVDGMDEEDSVTANKGACSCAPECPNIAVTSALVPTSTSTSIFNSSSSSSSSSDLPNLTGIKSSQEGEAGGGPPAEHGNVGSPRRPLPRSERPLSGPAWLEAFTAGIAAHTGRPCTAGRMYLATLERIVTHHAPLRDATSACAWLREQAQAFARQWDGKHPPKGLTPDGLERWLNEGRHGPPEFGKPRIVQLPAEEWHDDDWSDLGAKVLK